MRGSRTTRTLNSSPPANGSRTSAPHGVMIGCFRWWSHDGIVYGMHSVGVTLKLAPVTKPAHCKQRQRASAGKTLHTRHALLTYPPAPSTPTQPRGSRRRSHHRTTCSTSSCPARCSGRSWHRWTRCTRCGHKTTEATDGVRSPHGRHGEAGSSSSSSSANSPVRHGLDCSQTTPPPPPPPGQCARTASHTRSEIG